MNSPERHNLGRSRSDRYQESGFDRLRILGGTACRRTFALGHGTS